MAKDKAAKTEQKKTEAKQPATVAEKKPEAPSGAYVPQTKFK